MAPRGTLLLRYSEYLAHVCRRGFTRRNSKESTGENFSWNFSWFSWHSLQSVSWYIFEWMASKKFCNDLIPIIRGFYMLGWHKNVTQTWKGLLHSLSIEDFCLNKKKNVHVSIIFCLEEWLLGSIISGSDLIQWRRRSLSIMQFSGLKYT